jgi:hypothetical protein
VIGWIGDVSHHLQSLLDGIEFTGLCSFASKRKILSWCFNWGDSIIQVEDLTYLPLWILLTNYFHKISL